VFRAGKMIQKSAQRYVIFAMVFVILFSHHKIRQVFILHFCILHQARHQKPISDQYRPSLSFRLRVTPAAFSSAAFANDQTKRESANCE